MDPNDDVDAMEDLELQRRMKAVGIPTADADVRATLRVLGEPVTLFGEREYERSLRLRELLAILPDERLDALQAAEDEPAFEQPPPDKVFYTEGTQELMDARLKMAQFSLRRAAARLERERASYEADPPAQEERDRRIESTLRRIAIQSSELGDVRPVSSCTVSPDGKTLLTGSWSGRVKSWSLPTFQTELSVAAHEERITGVAWHPNPSGALSFATASADSTAKLWAADGTEVFSLTGHASRLARLAFHPMGRHLGTASYDHTWRLWDVERGECLLEQEGHSRPVYTVAFQNDGALAASGGLDVVGRLWDVRTGRNVLTLEGHIKPILSMDFSPNGYLLATGSMDNTARIYDLRKRDVLAVLPGHTSLVSRVRFEPTAGSYLLTCGYDRASRLWAAPTFRLTKTLLGHEDKVMDGDVCPGEANALITSGYDRTIKVFGLDPSDAPMEEA